MDSFPWSAGEDGPVDLRLNWTVSAQPASRAATAGKHSTAANKLRERPDRRGLRTRGLARVHPSGRCILTDALPPFASYGSAVARIWHNSLAAVVAGSDRKVGDRRDA